MKNKEFIFEDNLLKKDKKKIFEENDYVNSNDKIAMSNPFITQRNDGYYTIEQYGLKYKKNNVYLGSIIRNPKIKKKRKLKILNSYLKKQKKSFLKQTKRISRDNNDLSSNLDKFQIDKLSTKAKLIIILMIIINAFCLYLLNTKSKQNWIYKVSQSIINKYNNVLWFKIITIISLTSIILIFILILLKQIFIKKYLNNKRKYKHLYHHKMRIIRKNFLKEYKRIFKYYYRNIENDEKYYEAIGLDRIWDSDLSIDDFKIEQTSFETYFSRYKLSLKIIKVIFFLMLLIGLITCLVLLLNVILYGLTNI